MPAFTEVGAVITLQNRWRKRRRQCLLLEHAYTKWIDPQSGQYYYASRQDPKYTTWAKPMGDLPLQPMDPNRARKLRDERARQFAKHFDVKLERHRLVNMIRSNHAEEERKKKDKEIEQQRIEFENLWSAVFKYAAKTGELNLFHRHELKGEIHPHVYCFPDLFNGQKLIALRLVSHDLRQLPARIGEALTALTTLSLSSNGLTKLPESLCNLKNLTSLNVLRNRLTELPPRFGDLFKLHDLKIATNCLETLPPTFGHLTKLDRLVLDCNRIRRLPETLARLMCHTVSLNANRLISLPCTAFQMESLTFLSANDNKIRQIPNCIGESRSITRLSLCANEISEIPETLSLMSQLRELRLDHNKPLSTLPWNFFLLTSLQDLHMNGISGMLYPTQDKLVQGAAVVRDWFRRRQKHALFVRRHRIVTSYQDIMEQIVDAKPRICSPAYFEPDVSKDDEKWYAIVMDNFWEHVLPALRNLWDENRAPPGRVSCLPYTREEVEKVLRTYRDAEGPIQIENVTTFFRRCACVDADGNRKVCVPPAPGWMCKRKATFIKMHIVLQRERTEREKRCRERLAVDHAIEEARIAAREFAESEEGYNMFYVKARRQADKEMEIRRRRRWETRMNRKVEAAAEKIRSSFDKRRRLLKERRKVHEQELYRRLREDLEPKEDSLEGYARHKVCAEIDQVIKTIANLPEDQELDALEKELDAALRKSSDSLREGGSARAITLNSMFSLSKSDAKEHKELVNELEVDLVNRYTSKQVKKAERRVRQEHAKMRKIAASWAGLTTRDVFVAWRHHARREKRRRAKDRWRSKADELQAAADVAAALELARWNLGKYEKFVDQWTDMPFWKHAETGIVVWDEPQLEDLLPPRFHIPESMRDNAAEIAQVLQDQAETVIPTAISQDRQTSSESAASDIEDTSDESSWDESCEQSNDEEGSATTAQTPKSNEDSDGDRKPHGLLTQIVEDDFRDNESEEEGRHCSFENDDEDDNVLKWNPESARLPQLCQVASKAFADLEQPAAPGDRLMADERRKIEVEAALQRARIRRRLAVKHIRSQTNAEKSAHKNADATSNSPVQEEPFNVMQSVDFEPTKKYNQVQLTILARKAHKLNKKLGVKENMENAFEMNGIKKGLLAISRLMRPTGTARKQAIEGDAESQEPSSEGTAD